MNAGSPARRAVLATTLALGFAACADAPTTKPNLSALERLQQAVPGAHVYSDTGRISRVYGAQLATGAGAKAAADRFVAEYAELFGVNSDGLAVDSSDQAIPLMFDPATRTYRFTLFVYAQTTHGLPVYGADLRVLVANQPAPAVMLVVSSLRDLGSLALTLSGQRGSPKAAVRASAAATNYQEKARLTTGVALHRFSKPEAIVWAGLDRTEPAVEAFSFTADNFADVDAMPAAYRFVADARTGDVLHHESTIRTDASGTVTGFATTGTGAMECEPTAPTALPYAALHTPDGSTTYADEAGAFTIEDTSAGPLTVTSGIEGRYFTTENFSGPEASITRQIEAGGTADFVHNAADASDTARAEVNAYVAANEIRDWLLRRHPDYPTIANQTDMQIVVNRDGQPCPGAAWYSSTEPSIHFCAAGPDKTNTAFSTIVHHEFGHHIIEEGGVGFITFGPYDEGMADTIAMLYADDPRFGVGFDLNQCSEPFRNADNDCQYLPTGCSTCGGEFHSCGQLLSGSVWSVRNELIATEPDDYLALLSTLVINSIPLQRGRFISPQIAIDFLTLDDDDGDLSNGSPHSREICTGFGAHGLDCPEFVNFLSLTLPSEAREDAGAIAGATVAFSVAMDTDQAVTIASSDDSELMLPLVSVTIPAGELSAAFNVFLVNDGVPDGTQTVTVTATSAVAATAKATVRVQDAESVSLTLTVPANATEGDGVLVDQGRLTVSAPVGEDVTVQLSSSDTSEVVTPATLVVPAGSTDANFDITVVDDDVIDGPQPAAISASVPGWPEAFATLEIADDDALCGDGATGHGEECDDGDQNSDSRADACRTDCTLSRCGDGVIDASETCDDGEGNSDSDANSCRSNCALASCGDGVVDAGEGCDDGAGNGDGDADCRTTCVAAFCGDSVVDAGEQCDDGAGNSDRRPDACRADCALPVCGDGVVDSNEACDEGPGNGAATGACSLSCEVVEVVEEPKGGGCRAGESPVGSGAALVILLALAGRMRARARRRG